MRGLPDFPGVRSRRRVPPNDPAYQLIGKAVRNSVASKSVTRPPARTIRVRRFGAGLRATAGATTSGGIARANASLGGRAAGGGLAGRLSATLAGGGTMVGRLVSITIRSGHFWLE